MAMQKPRVKMPARGQSRAAKAGEPSTEETLVSTAERLFAMHGFDGVSTKQLAEESGMTIGALYHYFPSKSALYDAATRHALSRRAAAPQNNSPASEPPEKRLARLVAWFIDGIATDKSFGLLLRRELLDAKASQPLAELEVFHEALDLFRDLIRELAPEADVDAAVAAMAAMAFGFASLKGIYAALPSIRKKLNTPDQIAAYATKLLLDGVRR